MRRHGIKNGDSLYLPQSRRFPADSLVNVPFPNCRAMSGDGFRPQSRPPPAQPNSLSQPCAPFPSKPAPPQPPKPASHDNGPPKPISHSDPPLEPASLALSRCAGFARRPSSSSNPFPAPALHEKRPPNAKSASKERRNDAGQDREAIAKKLAVARTGLLPAPRQPSERLDDAAALISVLSMRIWHCDGQFFAAQAPMFFQCAFGTPPAAPTRLAPVRSVRVHRAAPGPPRPQLWAFCAQRLPHASDVP